MRSEKEFLEAELRDVTIIPAMTMEYLEQMFCGRQTRCRYHSSLTTGKATNCWKNSSNSMKISKLIKLANAVEQGS